MTGTVSPALRPPAGDALALIREALVDRRRGGDRLDELTRYAMAVPGKLLRPLMLIAAAEAVGGQAGAVLPAAVAVEHLHVASLVHDDIIDGDDLRRGRPSVHARHGIADAIVTGDALLFDLFAAAAESAAPPQAVVAAVAELARAGGDLCRGQVLESAMVPPGAGRTGSDLTDYLDVAAFKTGALFRAACRVGALLGGGTAGQADLLADYGHHTGVAFQMYDDLLPYLDGRTAAGKPATSDAANLRPTWPVLIAHRDGAAEHRRAVETALSGTVEPAEALELLRFAVLGSGALGTAREGARERSALAVARLPELPGAAAAGRLAALAEIAVDRDR
ncbi:polyprenyl synthetase family protein [Crossiella sp. CA-258035]|uniref:polyprenyl synthetase family protein n=1 Tax=Crossiella sp. CA-258035 TaxID=2981138 RepID=UPI0024BD5BE3|nr:polyprenyl synthetase family protein [Crossiella sp. CA-258035]WHT16171.1 polyprenyl synthetase family protein [Crossiella sp. CA-258035]